MSINSINRAIPLPPPVPSVGSPGMPGMPEAGNVGGSSFKDLLIDSIREVNTMQQDAQTAVEQLSTGEEVNMAEVMTAVQKADMSFRLMLQMRNKLVQAYNEIRQIQI
jgi:flagellar hook-basal body complex protein FliE